MTAALHDVNAGRYGQFAARGSGIDQLRAAGVVHADRLAGGIEHEELAALGVGIEGLSLGRGFADAFGSVLGEVDVVEVEILGISGRVSVEAVEVCAAIRNGDG